jgi:hypothetical protein
MIMKRCFEMQAKKIFPDHGQTLSELAVGIGPYGA